MAFAHMLQDIIQGLIGTGDEEPAPLSESYTYTQRLQPRCIRLLKLAPGPASSPIECTVQIHSIDNPPDFEALSYVWGSSADPVIIVCDSKRLTVTQNLHAALLQLRQFDTFRDGRLLWIDAICINQGDETEKTAQVRLMREIYSRAHNTTIWLGPNDDVLEGLSLIRSIDAAIQSHDFASPDELSTSVYHAVQAHVAANRLDGALTWTQIWHVLMKPWFGRIWVVQEYLLSKTALVWCGECVTQPEILFRAALALRPSRSLGIAMAPWDRALDIPQPVQLPAASFAALGVRHQASRMKLHEVVHETFDFLATDPRDRVFALVGLASDVDAEFVDYALGVREVHVNLAKNALRGRDRGDGGFLDILSYVRPFEVNDSDAPDLGLPSWVPELTRFDQRWSGHFQPLATLLHPIQFGSGFSLASIPMEFGDDESLHLRGVFLDTISSVIEDAPYSWAMSSSAFPPEVFQQVAHDLETWEGRAQRTVKSLSGYSDAAYARMLAFIPDIPSEREEFAELEASYKEFHDMIRIYPKVHNSHVKRVQHGTHDPGYDGLVSQLAEAAKVCKDFASRFDKYSKGRVFAGTKEGRMAWVPATAKPGDRIVVLIPSRIPFVVRSTSRGYRLLGDSFVQGLMAGELFSMLERSDPARFVFY